MFDQNQKNMVLALLTVAMVCAVILGGTDSLTREPIAKAQHEAFMNGLMQVLPEHANDPANDTVILQADDQTITYYLARNGEGNINGIAWETSAPDGYSGSIRMLIGVRPNGAVYAVRVTSHHETPGLGDGITLNHAWLDSFVDKTLTQTSWKVRKDGGDFDQFTGATISPRAVVKAVKAGLELFELHKVRILAPSEQKIQGKPNE
ncbi:MAG: NADH:ubiquinone oxidoreductase subunit RnfG [Zetaproteobacteria bacterium CG1_02_49_23]|nr:MAG: NADH:ubiquinone oxidoreductase subunit RnfG [Zetaproteobacteria bacterium CG1_02_49_23]